VRTCRAAAREHGWDPRPDDLLYRIAVHVAATDPEAWWDDWAPIAAAHRPIGALSTANRAVDDAAAGAGYYGRDGTRWRARLHAGGGLQERIETGQLLVGAPATVLAQADRVRRELGVGILELAFVAPDPANARRSLELFGTEVLLRMREW
jgi:hypothetical protein